MKFVYIIVLLSLLVKADEIERIESLVTDIQKLRMNYDNTQEKLALANRLLEDEKQKNQILLNELETKEIKINKLENKLKSLINNEKSNSENIEKVKVIDIECSKNSNSDENVFPQLQMRKSVVDTSAQTYRLNKDADVYDRIEGSVVQTWEQRTSFTSNYKEGDWIKVTGFFVDKVWQKAQQELWLHSNDADKRSAQ